VPASPPSKPDPVTTVIDNIYVRISWSEPANNGVSIESYRVMILKEDSLTLEESTSCTGSDPSVLYCLVEMSELTDPSLFNLPYGRVITARV
jgi:hypothetical protein